MFSHIITERPNINCFKIAPKSSTKCIYCVYWWSMIISSSNILTFFVIRYSLINQTILYLRSLPMVILMFTIKAWLGSTKTYPQRKVVTEFALSSDYIKIIHKPAFFSRVSCVSANSIFVLPWRSVSLLQICKWEKVNYYLNYETTT